MAGAGSPSVAAQAALIIIIIIIGGSCSTAAAAVVARQLWLRLWLLLLLLMAHRRQAQITRQAAQRRGRHLRSQSAMSHLCACIGSLCLRQCVHGAPIGRRRLAPCSMQAACKQHEYEPAPSSPGDDKGFSTPTGAGGDDEIAKMWNRK
eukprot:SAG25_NODE_1051_length_4176_cov_7.655139_2_plen_149_part_00